MITGSQTGGIRFLVVRIQHQKTIHFSIPNRIWAFWPLLQMYGRSAARPGLFFDSRRFSVRLMPLILKAESESPSQNGPIMRLGVKAVKLPKSPSAKYIHIKAMITQRELYKNRPWAACSHTTSSSAAQLWAAAIWSSLSATSKGCKGGDALWT